MSEPKLEAIAEVLIDIQHSIGRHPASIKGSGSFPTAIEKGAELRELGELQSRLARAARELKSETSRFSLKEQIALRAPRDQQWRTRNQLKRDRRSFRDVYKLAADTAKMLEELEKRNRQVKLVDILAAAVEPMHDHEQELLSELAWHKAHLPTLDLDVPTVQNVPFNLLIAVVFVLVAVRRRGDFGRPL